MARKKAETADEVRGRALVDIHGIAKCGEFITLSAEAAESLTASGDFDPNAQEIDESAE